QVNEQGMKSGQRAYLSIRNGRFTAHVEPGQNSISYTSDTHFLIVNSGNTPGYITSLKMSVRLAIFDKVGKFRISYGNIQLVARDMKIKGHATTDVQGQPTTKQLGFPPGDIDEGGRNGSTAWGVLQYRDVFQELHTAEWCWRAG